VGGAFAATGMGSKQALTPVSLIDLKIRLKVRNVVIDP